LWNLDILSEITEEQTLLVNGSKLEFDNRYLQFIQRSWTKDGRQQIVETIAKTFKIIGEVLTSYSTHYCFYQEKKTELSMEQVKILADMQNHMKYVAEKQQGVLTGLQNLASFERYKDDPNFKHNLSRLKNFVWHNRQYDQKIAKMYAKRRRQ